MFFSRALSTKSTPSPIGSGCFYFNSIRFSIFDFRLVELAWNNAGKRTGSSNYEKPYNSSADQVRSGPVVRLVVSKRCKPRAGIALGSGKSQPLRALCLSLSRYRPNKIILLCDSACFHLHQLHMVQGESASTRGLGPFAPPPLPLSRISLMLLPAPPLGLGHASPVRWLGPFATRFPIRH